jgi:hypothetical protein
MSEFDSAGTLFKSAPKSLAAFLAAGEERARLWRPEELGAIFRHQMSAPILVDLGGFDPATAGAVEDPQPRPKPAAEKFSGPLLASGSAH